MDDEQAPPVEPGSENTGLFRPDNEPPARSGRKRWLIAGFLIAAVAAAAIAVPVFGGGDAPKHTISGTMRLTDNDRTFSTPCAGSGGYSDMQPGAGVTVTDGTGKILAIGELGVSAGASHFCVFGFHVDDVPKADFYKIEVSHRGAITYSFARLDGANWEVKLTLGD